MTQHEKIELNKDNYVNKAEEVMKSEKLSKVYIKNGEEKRNYKITTSKLRSILTLVNDILVNETYNSKQSETNASLLDSSVAMLQGLRVRIVYDAGRQAEVETFVKESQILDLVKDIGNSKEKFTLFAGYMEALVAYHRYLGGKEN